MNKSVKTKITYITHIILIIALNAFFIKKAYEATGFKLSEMTFLYLITLIVLDLIFFVTPGIYNK